MEQPGMIVIGIISLVALIWLFTKSSKLTPEEREKMRKEYEDARLGIPPHDENGNIKCPFCGSTQIQMVNRKWSATTGFLTNKVDRVCMNCKKKF